ncbi:MULTISPECIES: carbohydrate ABC transporter permease [Micrococcales]|jgi:sn-glycerol 3-phosphate transport system permease protein|uniref:Carbohydrate ABC transporter membrane protein 2, CUT1 family n=2 Tax=Micrococcales TaxID=85006 RepID=A0A1G8JZH7_9MICC|nr:MULTISPECIES: carbohydrate ABC transporter permease [Micrococcales]AZS46123.1 L-arabinose transport system permease protein AraQ [Microbacterium oxydans]MCV7572826.1 carbohydrate ABC transporter permease [Micrococcus luteus]SDI36585.1 carbohydrate ABC transporter membrane protein 2, CUT1 family [Arthrobacter subterraneus]
MSFVTVTGPALAADTVLHKGARVRAASASAEDVAVASRTRLGTIAGHVVLIMLALFSVFPVYWMFATAFRAPENALDQTLLPWPLSLENFAYVWNTIPIGNMLWNTFAMSIMLAVAQLLIAVLAAYGFAMWDFRGRKLLMFLFIGSWLVPFQVTMIPNYVLVSQMGLLGTVGGVVIPQLAGAFAVLLMVQHMRAFPRELIEAAHLDGRSSWATLWTVVVPNMKPALAALGIMAFISAWNEYLWPTLIMRQGDALIQVGVRSFLSAEGNNWGATMAAAGLACVPVLLIYVFLQRYVVDAFVRSGLK